jgi:hypothetical protein
MLLLYLYARVLARRAFGAAPTYEARALFMYLLLSDGTLLVRANVAYTAFNAHPTVYSLAHRSQLSRSWLL